MRNDELIPTEKICLNYKVEHHFIRALSESGIIEVVTIEEMDYIPCDHLAEFERMTRLYHDLEINMEGLEAIHHLLYQIKQLQKDNRRLKNRLNLYE